MTLVLPDPPDVTSKKFLDELHERAGTCGHCGSRKCPDRKKWSILPDKLRTEDVLEALKIATVGEGVTVITWQPGCCTDSKVKTITCVCGTVDDQDLPIAET